MPHSGVNSGVYHARGVARGIPSRTQSLRDSSVLMKGRREPANSRAGPRMWGKKRVDVNNAARWTLKKTGLRLLIVIVLVLVLDS